MKKDVNTLKKHLSDLQTARRKLLEQDVKTSMDFLLKVGDLLKNQDNPEYSEEAERLMNTYNQTNELTKKLSSNLDKWISDLEADIKSNEQK